MYRSVYDLKMFYNSPAGEAVRRIISSRIRGMWSETKGLSVLGCGYAVPYLDLFHEESERVIAMMPRGQGADHYPKEGKNIVFLSNEDALPLPHCSIDRILIVHHLECCEHLQATLRECWRVLKPNGCLMLVVPNRTGIWARADWSPFGQGSPFSLSQVRFYLRDNLFVPERSVSSLFTPPTRIKVILRSSGVIEYIGRHFVPFFAGVHIVEATKQLYAGVDKTGSGSVVFSRPRRILSMPPVPVPQAYHHDLIVSSEAQEDCQDRFHP